ncbi:MAG: hypothetical protein SHS37scaffold145_75 [Phage 71_18]|nr:MAG: hypothetical protein SHS37scaffold145_75 [Phage 71_18]
MTRHAYVKPRLDALHAILREHPGLSADELAKLLPKRACSCTHRSTGSPRGDCWACKGTGMAHAGRAVAYTDLRKLEDDGRARRELASQGIAHAWFAVVTDDDLVADDLDEHWDWLGAQAPVSAELALEEAVREHARLAHLLADKDRTRATTQRELDELICGLCDGRMQKDVAALLGIRPHDVRAARDRLWRQRSAGRS